MNIMFVETWVFTQRLAGMGLEEELKDLQEDILANPEAGRLDPGTGGLRELRVRDRRGAKGKRGGARVHYLWLSDTQLVYLLFVYGKDEVDTVTPAQKRVLRGVVNAIKTSHGRRKRET
jgi:mRNA-degrading endonuclease RelE of RelBE toxin-antitoxin system